MTDALTYIYRHMVGLAVAIVIASLLGIGLAQLLPAPERAGAILRLRAANGLGTGFHVGGGLVFTAAHVARFSHDGKFRATDDAGGKHTGEVLWRNDRYDVAMIRVNRWYGLGSLRMRCKTPAVGDAVSTTGHPMGMLFLSAYGRIASIKPNALGRRTWRNVIMADMKVHSGMSGGPVLDSSGAIVGMLVGALRKRIFGTPFASGENYSFIVPASALCGMFPKMR